jgi:hypothetical protein
MSSTESLAPAWRERADAADARAGRLLAARTTPNYQVIIWRAQADTLRWCAEELEAAS